MAHMKDPILSQVLSTPTLSLGKKLNLRGMGGKSEVDIFFPSYAFNFI